MSSLELINKEKQVISRCKKSLALEKIKQRRADTRRKIEFGGLIIKSGMSGLDKPVILGALKYLFKLMETNPSLKDLFRSTGDKLFNN